MLDFVILKVFNRNQRKYLKLRYLNDFLIAMFSLKFQCKHCFHVNFTSLKNCLKNTFFYLEIVTSCNYTQIITLQKNLVCLIITNLKYKGHNNFHQFLLLFQRGRDGSLNPRQVEIYSALNSNTWESINTKALYFFHELITNILPKINGLKYMASKTSYWDKK